MKPLSLKAAIYLRAAELVEMGHCKHVQAQDADGRTCSPYADEAAYWCIAGAVFRSQWEATGKQQGGLRNFGYFGPFVASGHHADWNNAPERTASEVAARLREEAFKEEDMDKFDVVAVDLVTNKVRIMATDRARKDAEAVVNIAVMRRGVDEEFYCEVPAGKYHEGDEWNVRVTHGHDRTT